KIYENAFEWRFELTEVLDDDGNYVGFDVVIGNPPYGVSIKGQYRKHLVENLSKVPDYEIYYWFIDRSNQILRNNGVSSYIIPNSILFNVFAQNYRMELFENWNLNEILDCTDIDIFEDATVRNIIFLFTKSKNSNNLGYKRTDGIESFQELSNRNLKSIDKKTVEINNQNWGLIFKLNKETLKITQKLKNQSKCVSDFFDVTQGYIPYRKSDLIKLYGEAKASSIVKNREWHSNSKLNDEYKEEIFGESISKYGYKHTDSYVWYGKHLATYVNLKFFNQKRLLIREITNPTIIASIVEEEFVNDPQIIVAIPKTNDVLLETLWAIMNSKLATYLHFNSSPKATKGAFPKVLVSDIKNFPIPDNISIAVNEIMIHKTNSILKAKQTDPTSDTTALEREIDQLVYALYGLTDEEIKIVENS
ncbi:MAG: Eco57I restriction-modification methylase domain-containing protein, partial [Crocinitomicaceae bacterium]|nr:Eco57I restriction-modification methylase domain-containing protein [Crocinitomicaceae bacterium]